MLDRYTRQSSVKDDILVTVLVQEKDIGLKSCLFKTASTVVGYPEVEDGRSRVIPATRLTLG